jgi:hypothetical protein
VPVVPCARAGPAANMLHSVVLILPSFGSSDRNFIFFIP